MLGNSGADEPAGINSLFSFSLFFCGVCLLGNLWPLLLNVFLVTFLLSSIHCVCVCVCVWCCC